jgi:hypothetical protein
MPSREQAAAVNVRAAIRAASAEFELKDLARTIDGYSATFQMGMVTHVESGSTTRSSRMRRPRRPFMGSSARSKRSSPE